MGESSASRNPGPGAYQFREHVGREGAMSTIRPRRSSGALISKHDVPGPGTYNTYDTKSKAPAFK